MNDVAASKNKKIIKANLPGEINNNGLDEYTKNHQVSQNSLKEGKSIRKLSRLNSMPDRIVEEYTNEETTES